MPSIPTREIRITTAVAPVTSQPATDDVDVNDRAWAMAVGRGLICHRLVDSDLVPVCSPQLAKTFCAGRPVDVLAKQTLLHSLAVPNDWAIWLAAGRRAQFRSESRPAL